MLVTCTVGGVQRRRRRRLDVAVARAAMINVSVWRPLELLAQPGQLLAEHGVLGLVAHRTAGAATVAAIQQRERRVNVCARLGVAVRADA